MKGKKTLQAGSASVLFSPLEQAKSAGANSYRSSQLRLLDLWKLNSPAMLLERCAKSWRSSVTYVLVTTTRLVFRPAQPARRSASSHRLSLVLQRIFCNNVCGRKDFEDGSCLKITT